MEIDSQWRLDEEEEEPDEAEEEPEEEEEQELEQEEPEEEQEGAEDEQVEEQQEEQPEGEEEQKKEEGDVEMCKRSSSTNPDQIDTLPMTESQIFDDAVNATQHYERVNPHRF